MKGFLAFLAGLFAVVAFAALLPLGWVMTHIADEDGYVELSRGVLEDTETRDALVGAVSDELAGQTRERLLGLGVPPQLVDQALATVEGFVGQGLGSAAVVDAWGESQREAHQQMFREDGSGFVVELSPLVSAVAVQAGVDLEVPANLPVEDDSTAARRAVQLIGASPLMGVAAALVAFVGALTAVLLANRRGAALAWLAAGGLLAVGVSYVGARVVSASDVTTSTGAGDRVAQALIDVARDSYGGLLSTAALGAGAVLVVGLVIAIAGAVRRGRDPVAAP
ncbi:hypothetical protein [Aeromicrobium sp. Leaf350]|uniref:hypothetical protein n=1 Tax=Aeromicrobium sp. Leaf350 TaxID=2876565 RepID=UPI001E4B2B2A|nr:hypothetical protein [Aeromicrobium sp. Leaf350]